MAQAKDSIENAKKLMGALSRMPPKPRVDMKIGKPTKKSLLSRPSRNQKLQKRPTSRSSLGFSFVG